jgi:acyl-coenzyme A thioesterase PaaI-like protein
MEDGCVAMGQSHSISFLRPVTEGEIEVRARGRTEHHAPIQR